MRNFTDLEKHRTKTNYLVSVGLKLIICRFILSSLLLLFVNYKPELWYEAGNLVNDASTLMIMIAFQAPFMEMLNLRGIFKFFKKNYEKLKGSKCQLT